MMTRNDAVALQQFCAMMTFSDALPVLPPKMMDTVTTRAWEFSQTLNQNIEGLARGTIIVWGGLTRCIDDPVFLTHKRWGRTGAFQDLSLMRARLIN